MGYHKRQIEKGEVGKSSKILEEVQELLDAEEQNARIMVLCELADIVGAIKCYLYVNYPDIDLHDLDRMASLTAEAFKDGSRK